jgi:hypothetical protein
MANGGWYRTDEEWTRIEEPLLRLDADLDRFARKHGLALTKNHKDWPERSLTWKKGDVHCLIQVYLVDESGLSFNLWISAYQDRGERRFGKQETPRKEAQAAELEEGWFEVLEAQKRKVDDWAMRPEELEFATNIRSVRA